MLPKLFWGPTTWQRAPKKNMALRKEIAMVDVIMTANFWNVTS